MFYLVAAQLGILNYVGGFYINKMVNYMKFILTTIFRSNLSWRAYKFIINKDSCRVGYYN